MQVTSGTDKQAAKDSKSNALEPDQEVPNVLVRLVLPTISTSLFIIITYWACHVS